MMSGGALPEYNEEAIRARVAAGFRGGMWFKDPMVLQNRTIVDGYPMEVAEKSFFTPIAQAMPTTPWNASRQAGGK